MLKYLTMRSKYPAEIQSSRTPTTVHRVGTGPHFYRSTRPGLVFSPGMRSLQSEGPGRTNRVTDIVKLCMYAPPLGGTGHFDPVDVISRHHYPIHWTRCPVWHACMSLSQDSSDDSFRFVPCVVLRPSQMDAHHMSNPTGSSAGRM